MAAKGMGQGGTWRAIVATKRRRGEIALPLCGIRLSGRLVESGLRSDDLKGRAPKLEKLSDRRSRLKLEALASASDMGYAASNSTRLVLGHCFTLSGTATTP